MIRANALFLAVALTLALQVAAHQEHDLHSESLRKLSRPSRHRHAAGSAHMRLLRQQRASARRFIQGTERTKRAHRRSVRSSIRSATVKYPPVSDLLREQRASARRFIQGTERTQRAPRTHRRSARSTIRSTTVGRLPLSDATLIRLALTQRSPEHVAFSVRSPEHLTQEEKSNAEAAEQESGAECGKCKEGSASKDSKRCHPGLHCFHGRCVLNGAGEAQSVKTCFPNLAECEFCFKDQQCGLGLCHAGRCIRQKDDATVFAICGVRTAALTPNPWSLGFLGGQVRHRFNSFKNKFGF